jgi:hypothetical protein
MRTITLTVSIFLLPLWSHASIQFVGIPEKSEVNFLAVGKPSMLKIHGKATGPEANLKLEKGNLSGVTKFVLDQLDTGIGLRNQHMKEKYLQTKEFPKAELTILTAAVDPGFENSMSNGEKPFLGRLKLHGKEQNVSGIFSVSKGIVMAKFTLKVTDYGIEIPSYLGVTVTDSVDVSVNLALMKE